MPKHIHEALKKEAAKKGLKGEEADRYVFGGLKKFEEHDKGYSRKGSEKHGQPKHEHKPDDYDSD